MRLLDLGYMVPHGWREVTVADIATKVGSGATPRGGSSVYTDTGIPLVRSQNVLDNVFNHAGLAFITERSAQSLKNVELQADDVLLNITGDSILRCCLLPDTMIGGRVNQHVAIIRATDEVVPQYLQKWLVQDWFKDFMLSHSAGATRKAITKGQILSFPIAIPPIAEQRRIAGVLGALDDKIESNRNLTELIPNLIDALIKRELSKGCGNLLPVSKLAKFINGGAYTKGASGSGRMVVRIADLNSGPGASTIYNDIDVPDDKLAHVGDILMSWSGSLGVYVWVREEAIVNQHIFKVVLTDFPAWLVHNRLNEVLGGFRSIAADKATTMGHIQRKHLNETLVEVPVMRLERLEHLCEPLWHRFISAQLESLRLAELRDALLSELMSGRMRVDEAGRLVSEALDEEVR